MTEKGLVKKEPRHANVMKTKSIGLKKQKRKERKPAITKKLKRITVKTHGTKK